MQCHVLANTLYFYCTKSTGRLWWHYLLCWLLKWYQWFRVSGCYNEFMKQDSNESLFKIFQLILEHLPVQKEPLKVQVLQRLHLDVCRLSSAKTYSEVSEFKQRIQTRTCFKLHKQVKFQNMEEKQTIMEKPTCISEKKHPAECSSEVQSYSDTWHFLRTASG